LHKEQFFGSYERLHVKRCGWRLLLPKIGRRVTKIGVRVFQVDELDAEHRPARATPF
jgi:hypothetical protein